MGHHRCYPSPSGGVDWTGRKFFRRDVKVDIIALILSMSGEGGLSRSEMEEQCSNVFELVAFITLVILRGPHWKGHLVIWGGDNQVALEWVKTRKAGNPVARALLRVLALYEARWKFKIVVAYLRTYHNTVADSLTRDTMEAVRGTASKLSLDLVEADATSEGVLTSGITPGPRVVRGVDPGDDLLADATQAHRSTHGVS